MPVNCENMLKENLITKISEYASKLTATYKHHFNTTVTKNN